MRFFSAARSEGQKGSFEGRGEGFAPFFGAGWLGPLQNNGKHAMHHWISGPVPPKPLALLPLANTWGQRAVLILRFSFALFSGGDRVLEAPIALQGFAELLKGFILGIVRVSFRYHLTIQPATNVHACLHICCPSLERNKGTDRFKVSN